MSILEEEEEEAGSSDTLIPSHHATLHHIPEGSTHHIYCCKNLKLHTKGN